MTTRPVDSLGRPKLTQASIDKAARTNHERGHPWRKWTRHARRVDYLTPGQPLPETPL